MKITPPKAYSEEHLKILFKDLPPGSYLAGFLTSCRFDNKALFNLIVKQSHSAKYNSHTKNLIRSIRCILFSVETSELPLWVSEVEPEIKAVVKWRLSTVG